MGFCLYWLLVPSNYIIEAAVTARRVDCSASITEVKRRRARLVLGWVTAWEFTKKKIYGWTDFLLRKLIYIYIKQSRVSYTIYNSRTAGRILMIFYLLDSSPLQIAE